MVSNKKGFTPKIYNGKPIKAINQGYNKRISKYKEELPFKNKSLDDSYYVTVDKNNVTKKVLKQEHSSKKPPP